jgi:hypothetical protein
LTIILPTTVARLGNIPKNSLQNDDAEIIERLAIAKGAGSVQPCVRAIPGPPCHNYVTRGS